MRTLVEPAPVTRCDHCGGELRLKLIETANETLDLNDQVFVCASCGHEKHFIVDHDHHMPHLKVA